MNKTYCSLLLFLLFLASTLSAQSILRVKQDATGTNDGTSWQNAFTDLHTALAAAQSGDQIWVAEGVYFPTNGTDRDQHFTQKSGTQLFGGFAGTEQSPEERDWEEHPTILSGDIGNPADSSDNSYCVVFMHSPALGTIIDGCTIRDGLADKAYEPNQQWGRAGAGLQVFANNSIAFPTIKNVKFLNNTAFVGAGACVFSDFNQSGVVVPRFYNCFFKNNTAYGSQGGAVAVAGVSDSMFMI